MRFAIVENGVTVNIAESEYALENNWVEITDENAFDYTRPAPVEPTINRITKRSFMRRFSQTERIAIRASVDDIVIDIHEDLKMASNVNLTDQDTVNALGYLNAIGILSPERIAEILVNGTQAEKDEGL